MSRILFYLGAIGVLSCMVLVFLAVAGSETKPEAWKALDAMLKFVVLLVLSQILLALRAIRDKLPDKPKKE